MQNDEHPPSIRDVESKKLKNMFIETIEFIFASYLKQQMTMLSFIRALHCMSQVLMFSLELQHWSKLYFFSLS